MSSRLREPVLSSERERDEPVDSGLRPVSDALWSAAPFGMAHLDAKFRVMRANPKFRELAACIYEPLGAPLAKSAPELWSHTQEALEDIAQGRRASVVLDLPLDSSGAERWISVQGVALTAPGQLGLYLHDITSAQRRQQELGDANEELREQVGEYETLLRVIPIGISVARDPECRSIISNHHHANVLRLSSPRENSSIDPRASQPASFRIYRDGVEINVDELPMHRAIAERREITNVECDVIVEGGQRLTLIGHAAPLFDENENVRGAVGAFDNITERKLAEERLTESERQFRELATENARLYEEARTAIRMRDEFVASVSHELRTPLAVILAWTSFLQKGSSSPHRSPKGL